MIVVYMCKPDLMREVIVTYSQFIFNTSSRHWVPDCNVTLTGTVFPRILYHWHVTSSTQHEWYTFTDWVCQCQCFSKLSPCRTPSHDTFSMQMYILYRWKKFIIPEIQNLNHENILIQLLSLEDPIVILATAKFIHACLKKRMLDNTQDKWK